jgi:hypothetical protein
VILNDADSSIALRHGADLGEIKRKQSLQREIVCAVPCQPVREAQHGGSPRLRSRENAHAAKSAGRVGEVFQVKCAMAAMSAA